MVAAGPGADVSDFDHALSIVLAHEGGWSDHPADPGGATMNGITLALYRRYAGNVATKNDLRGISDSMLRTIYGAEFWHPCRCDDWPWPVALAVFDTAVNCGPGRAKRWLQKAADVVPDKVLGPMTARAILSGSPARAVILASEVLAHRLGHYMLQSSDVAFGFGWARRVLDIQREALKDPARH